MCAVSSDKRPRARHARYRYQIPGLSTGAVGQSTCLIPFVDGSPASGPSGGLRPFECFDFFFSICDLTLPIKRFPPPPHPRDCLRLSAKPREYKQPLVCLNLPTTQREWNRCSHSSNDGAPVPTLSLSPFQRAPTAPISRGNIIIIK